jgi:hypothetical protein
LPSRHRNKVDRFINRRVVGLVGFMNGESSGFSVVLVPLQHRTFSVRKYLGYPGSVLRSTAVRKMASLRRLQFGQIKSHRYIWVIKSPQHTLPKKVTKNRCGNRTTIT